MTALTPEFLEKLRAAIDDPAFCPDIYAESLREKIDAIGETPSHETFYEICELAAMAYPAGELSDAMILGNKATPVLFNYLLGALRIYRDQIDQAKTEPNTSSRGEFLQLAFGGRGGKRGGNTRGKPWGEARKKAVYGVFSKRFRADLENNRSVEDAWLAGFESAYEHAFKSDTLDGRDPAQAKKNRAQLEALMNEHQPRETVSK